MPGRQLAGALARSAGPPGNRTRAAAVRPDHGQSRRPAGGGFSKLIQLLRLVAAGWQVKRLLRKERIELVFTTGGYIAAPAILGPPERHPRRAARSQRHSRPGDTTAGPLLQRRRAAGGIRAHPRLHTAAHRHAGPCRLPHPQPLPDWVPEGDGPLLVVIGGSQEPLG